jgi:ABC-type lipoprotein release transport system permease subunit
MAAIMRWFWLDVRRRWRSLLVLALLIALAAATVLTAVAGASRSASVVDRLLAVTLPPTAVVLPNEPGFDWEAVRALPEVEALATFVVGGFAVDGVPPEAWDVAISFPWADDEIMRTIERPVVLEGRLADPSRADEAVITAKFEDSFGKGVGDTVTFRLLTPEQADAVYLDGVEPTSADGPAVEATIVGVVRSGWFSEESADHPGMVVASAGLYAEYAPNLIGAQELGYINALVRLHGGEGAIPAFNAGLEQVSGRSDIDVWNWADEVRHLRSVTGFEANSLLVFAVAAGIAAVFLVGQSIARYTASTVTDLNVLRGAGMTPGQATLAAVAGPAAAGSAGTALGVAAAIVASRWFPIGNAAPIEPAPGIDVDAAVLGAGLVVVPLGVALGAFGAAILALRAGRVARSGRRSAAATAAGRAGAPVPAIVGTRFALEPGSGNQAVPVRPALIGAVTGVVGVLAAVTFSHGISDAAANPGRFGQTHALEAFLGYNGATFGPVDELLPMIAADTDVVGVADTRTAVAQGGGVAIAVFAADQVGEPLDVVLVSGRMPDGPGQMAVAPRTTEAAGFEVGDTVSVSGPRADRDIVITGIAFVPQASHNDYASGAWVTRETYDSLFGTDGVQAFKQRQALLTLAPGADPSAVAERIGTGLGIDGFLALPQAPVELAELQQIRILPAFLAAFLAVLALGAVGHALATAVRRRRHDVAVLRSLGMTRAQSRWVVATQATVLAVVGLLVGVPLGVALGRTVWRYVADTTPLHYIPPVAALAVLLAAPVALLAVNLLAAWPGHRAASLRLSHVLRTE